ncbi:MAG: putative toxin-antitoxin system toxin component, PIN family [Planctomycetes bacterium]|nr:putative toxin-antitoxin system toxin component, PIN family [Planctomycetota bacterium]
MRAVLDTNVVVSGLATPTGVCAQILDLAVEGKVQPCVDARVLEEYERVLRRPELPIAPGKAEEFLEFIPVIAEVVSPTPLAVRLPHGDDLPFLETAREAAAVLVSRNLRHFPPRHRAGVTVLSPWEFLDLLARRVNGPDRET